MEVEGHIAILSKIIREGLTDKMIFEQKLEGDQRNTLRYPGKDRPYHANN